MFDAIQDAVRRGRLSEGDVAEPSSGRARAAPSREWIATPDEGEVALPHGYARNPTIDGTRTDDTYLVSDDDIELLSGTGDWPTETVSAVGYDLELPRHTVLEL